MRITIAINQLTDQPTNRPTDQPTNRPTDRQTRRMNDRARGFFETNAEDTRVLEWKISLDEWRESGRVSANCVHSIFENREREDIFSKLAKY